MAAVYVLQRDRGAVRTPEEALAAISREDFIPDLVYVPGPDYWLVPLVRSAEPGRWRRLVNGDDEPVVTKVGYDPTVPADLCDPESGRGMVATSSSSSPRIMARMIDTLELAPGMRVLEIGTGTGYNAAVLAFLLGVDQVTSIEIDPEVAEQARTALGKSGWPVQVITGDGEAGYPPGAPYDRIIVTAAAHTVPYAWVEQTRPGGMLLVPWAPTVHPGRPLARFAVSGTGRAEGRFIGEAGFMPLHAHHLLPRVDHDTEERWRQAGRPDYARYGITVTREGQRIWLDSPTNPIPAEIPGH
ncbi:methyltransferase domain-containing protein [Actinomadura roseirufa]|uniref:methyltransferase domain-containing protein n=1 Tax=Actinomadura roseirufa TaxID=2094049 RepID=UPI0010413BB4|nr:methyltransferase domain-containing protein [Actinomadura roseirufa]